MTVFRPSRRKFFVARWTDPETGKRQQRSLDTSSRRAAFDAAAGLADKILAGVSIEDYDWIDFCALYEKGHLVGKSSGHQENWRAVKWSVEQFGIRSLAAINATWIQRWQNSLRDRGLSQNTIASYSTRLRAALHWAARRDMLLRVPYIEVRFEEHAASRAVTDAEFKEILAAIKSVRKKDWFYWRRLLRGLAQSNLRIGELADLSWDETAPIHIDRRGPYPLIRMAPGANKKRKTRIQAITPEFWEVCCETPEEKRSGPVFPIPNGRGGNFSRDRIVRNIGKIGEKAGIVTNAEKGKHATSHDIGRRAFVRKVDGKLTPMEVHKWMGHASFDTTVTFYDTRDAEDLAAKLWASRRGPSGASGDTCPDPADDT